MQTRRPKIKNKILKTKQIKMRRTNFVVQLIPNVSEGTWGVCKYLFMQFTLQIFSFKNSLKGNRLTYTRGKSLLRIAYVIFVILKSHDFFL